MNILFLNSKLKVLIRRLVGNLAFSSKNYWEKRYKGMGTSGAGSYGRLAQFKSEVINNFILEHDVHTVLEFGCGDGNQLLLANYPSYRGVDVSRTAIELCRNKFSSDLKKQFCLLSDYKLVLADLTLSLDVIYHLVEDRIYLEHMHYLFDSSNKYVIIYSSNHDDLNYDGTHERHRNLTRWVEQYRRDFKLTNIIKNRYPFSDKNPNDTSHADFYFFERAT
jgi:SAM-dependent methyltransferase